MLNNIKTYFISIPAICISTFIFLFKLHYYNEYISERYLNGNGLNIASAFSIAGDPRYRDYLIGGFFFIFLLIISAAVAVIFSIKNYKYDNNFIFVGIATPILNLVILIVLLVMFSNPVLIVFTIFIGGGGLYAVSQS